jgi:hypothetical protein
MDWLDFEKILLSENIYFINNNKNLNIVLFGSCHMATIGFMLNKLLNYDYNIYIIISWFFQSKGIENFDMNHINNKITNTISNCDIFIYHEHINDYHINASNLHNLIKYDCLKLCIPNFRLDYINENYSNSLSILKNNINNSLFFEVNFIIENHTFINLFNTNDHPTHYLLFLLSQSIKNKIIKNNIFINIDNYYNIDNRMYFKLFYYVILPGKIDIDNEINEKTGILINSDYFD